MELWLAEEAGRLHEEALERRKEGAEEEAIRLYLEAVGLDPSLLAREDHGLLERSRSWLRERVEE